MPTVTVLPADIAMETQPGETLLGAAQRLGYTWPTVCGGEGQCRTCYAVIEQGEDALSPVTALEEEASPALAIVARRAGKPVRLACQAVPTGDITVQRSGVRKS
ncbi:2Fe-2S iron-sulfur cluster-binding protein [Paraurantiacibacter namhicola]|uniref:Phenol hydroxylase P5 protein n=1 Tax=Paraurantiacibacter namhicola TaxID=645517 RepID=A0A1C7DAJ3_9SPHN|nr:2Fe-2S iron-sulfur cluster-binding protein [Paraurantiacibacter namhicola]ANU08437.1 Phenol hydroxylase P5 protein [Paraurantiacibacter namhicola]